MKLLLIAALLAASPATAQPVPENVWRDIGAKFGELIRRKGFNCQEGKVAVPKGEDAYGKVYQVFCGPVGVDPLKDSSRVIAFRLTFGQKGALTVVPWVE